MTSPQSKITPLILFSVDIALLAISFFIVTYFKFGALIIQDKFYALLFLGCEVLWILVVLKYNLYEVPRIIYQDKILTKNFNALIVYVFLGAALIFFITTYKFSRLFFIFLMLLFSILILIWRALLFFLIKKYRTENSNHREIVIIGFNQHIERLVLKVFTEPKYEYKLAGIFTMAKLKKPIKKYFKGQLEDAISYLEENSIKEIIISLPQTESQLINELLVYADNNLIRVSIVPEFSEYLSQLFAIEYVENVPLMKFREEPLQSLSNRILKRFMDVIIVLVIIIFIFSWLFPIIAILIKLDSKGPVFFKQLRTGKDGESFNCLKFRSMTVNGNSDKVQATKGDARITKVGAILRRTSLDELPQFFNVLFNNMSLVGPRPHMLKHTDEYRLLVDKFMVRHFAKPGVTGWAQILGYRGETKTVGDMEQRANADIWYIENWSLMLDLKILLRTVWVIVFKKEDKAY